MKEFNVPDLLEVLPPEVKEMLQNNIGLEMVIRKQHARFKEHVMLLFNPILRNRISIRTLMIRLRSSRYFPI